MEKGSVEIVLGSTVLARLADRKSRITAATVTDVVFKNCPASMENSLVLERALRGLPADLRKLNGWKIQALKVGLHLGYSIPKNENVAI